MTTSRFPLCVICEACATHWISPARPAIFAAAAAAAAAATGSGGVSSVTVVVLSVSVFLASVACRPILKDVCKKFMLQSATPSSLHASSPRAGTTTSKNTIAIVRKTNMAGTKEKGTFAYKLRDFSQLS